MRGQHQCLSAKSSPCNEFYWGQGSEDHVVGTYNACVIVVGEDKTLIELVEVAQEYLNKIQTYGMLKYFPQYSAVLLHG